MTAKRSISVPDDVADGSTASPTSAPPSPPPSAPRWPAPRSTRCCAGAGIEVTEAGKARWRDRLSTPIPDDALAEGQRMLDEAA